MPRPLRPAVFPVVLLALLLAACTPESPPGGAVAPGNSSAAPRFEGDFTPEDDGAASPAFSAFRNELRAIVARRDTAALLARVAPGAQLSFGDAPGGPEGFRRMWFSGSPPEGAGSAWAVLARLLDGGSVEEDGVFMVPFVYGLWPSDVDPFSHVAVTGEDVPARAEPRADAPVVARLTHLIVPVLAPPRDGWWTVQLPSEEAAYVPAEHAHSAVGYRAGFWPEGDSFRLQFFIAGD